MVSLLRTAALLCLLSGCGVQGRSVADIGPMSEKVLAARKLKQPLSRHLCQAAVYPSADRAWRVTPVAALSGRGTTFQEALEALCREADGLRLPAVADIHYIRPPSGWTGTQEVRGTGLAYEPGFTPPPPPGFAEIQPPPLPRAAVEPPPAGER
jgi:hypothetical protein